MKALILSTLLASVALATAMEAPCTTTETGCEKAVVVKVIGGEGDEATADLQVVTVGAEGVAQQAGCGTAKVMIVEADDDGGEERKIKVVTRIAHAVDENRGWLGVALGEVSEELAEENDVDAGVVVLNVVKDSPAEEAGLQENDIITHLNGEKIEGGVSALAKGIGELGPGGVANLTVVREGRTLELPATLATSQHEFEWTHAPDVHFKNYMRWHPRGLKVAPGGGLQWFGIDELEELEDLPSAVAEAFANMNATVQLSFDDGKKSLQIVTNKNGNVIKISQEDDGPIFVTRYTEGQDDESEVEYATPEALKAGDPEAFEIYDRSQSRTIIIHDDDEQGFDFDFDLNVGDWIPDDICKRIEIHLRDADAQMEDAHKAVEEAMRRIPNLHFDGGAAARAKLFVGEAQVMRSFKVNPEGQIEMILRKGDTEVVKVFSDEADLKAREPEAYEHYQGVLHAPVDE